MTRRVTMRLPAAAAALFATLCMAGMAAGQSKPDRAFAARVAPLLARACLECHGPAQKQGGLDLTTLKGALTGGARGPALVPGKPEAK